MMKLSDFISFEEMLSAYAKLGGTAETLEASFRELKRTQTALALIVDKARREERQKYKEAIKSVLIGGNHLATHIGGDHPPYTATTDEALEFYGAERILQYDIWCCWRAIMLLSKVLGDYEIEDNKDE